MNIIPLLENGSIIYNIIIYRKLVKMSNILCYLFLNYIKHNKTFVLTKNVIENWLCIT